MTSPHEKRLVARPDPCTLNGAAIETRKAPARSKYVPWINQKPSFQHLTSTSLSSFKFVIAVQRASHPHSSVAKPFLETLRCSVAR